MSYLIDTDVLSEWCKATPDAGVANWFSTVAADDVYISVVTFGEIRRAIAKLQLRNDHRQSAIDDTWLNATQRRFSGRVVPVGIEIAEEWGYHTAKSPMPTADGLIAATAKVHGWTLVTRNLKDFEPTAYAC